MNFFVLIFLLSLFLDQVSKFGAEGMGFETVFNPGISFYWLSGIEPAFLTWTLLIFIVFLAVAFRRLWREHPITAGWFLGAAASNWLDRVLWGGVRDWLPVPGIELKNNMADWIIVISLGWLVWSEIIKEHKSNRVAE